MLFCNWKHIHARGPSFLPSLSPTKSFFFRTFPGNLLENLSLAFSVGTRMTVFGWSRRAPTCALADAFQSGFCFRGAPRTGAMDNFFSKRALENLERNQVATGRCSPHLGAFLRERGSLVTKFRIRKIRVRFLSRHVTPYQASQPHVPESLKWIFIVTFFEVDPHVTHSHEGLCPSPLQFESIIVPKSPMPR